MTDAEEGSAFLTLSRRILLPLPGFNQPRRRKKKKPKPAARIRYTPALVRLMGEKPVTASVTLCPPAVSAGTESETEILPSALFTDGISRQTRESAVMTK